MAGQGFTFYEFFAGGGMAHAGLGTGNWDCLFANDFDRKKCESYARNWGDDALVCGDVAKLKVKDLPGRANLVWASFPCQDLSLAGGGAGLRGDRSGTFWPFWRLMDSLIADGRAPDIIALENVTGTLTSHGGKDFEAICNSFVKSGYRFGAVVIDAALFVPHSRPRLFVVGVREGIAIPRGLIGDGASAQWHPKALRTAYDMLPSVAKDSWLWWRLSPPPLSNMRFADLIEATPASVTWHSEAETQKLLSMMSTGHLDQMISHLIEKDAHDYQTVVDVGCGNGAMRTKVRSPKYVGIDLHISTEGDDNTTFIQSSVSEAKISHLKLGLTSFYMINCLCYCERVDDLGDFVSANMSSGDVLNIIEPINAFWWETDFDGIRVHVRSPTQIKHRLSAEGLILDESIFCYMDRLLPFAPFRVFQAHRFKKQ